MSEGVRVPHKPSPAPQEANPFLVVPETPVKSRDPAAVGSYIPRLPALDIYAETRSSEQNPSGSTLLSAEQRFAFTQEDPEAISTALRSLGKWFREGASQFLSKSEKERIGDNVVYFSTCIRLAEHWGKKDLSGGNSTGLTLEQSIALVYKSVELPPTPQKVRFGTNVVQTLEESPTPPQKVATSSRG